MKMKEIGPMGGGGGSAVGGKHVPSAPLDPPMKHYEMKLCLINSFTTNEHILPEFYSTASDKIQSHESTSHTIFSCAIKNWLSFIHTVTNTSRKVTDYFVKLAFISTNM